MRPKNILTLSKKGVHYFYEGPKIGLALTRVQVYLPFNIYETQKRDHTQITLFLTVSKQEKRMYFCVILHEIQKDKHNRFRWHENHLSENPLSISLLN